MKQNSIGFNRLIQVLIVLYAFVPILPNRVNSLFLFFIIPAIFIVSLIQYPGFIKENKVFKYYFYYFVFSLLTILWAHNRQLCFSYLQFYVGNFLITYVFSSLSTNEKYRKTLYLFYFLYLGSCLLLGYTGYAFAEDDISSSRVGGEGLNANRFGYFVFIVTFILFYIGELNSNKKIWRFLFLLTIPLSFYIALITASRQLLIIQAPYITLLLLHRYLGKLNVTNVVISLLFVIAVVFLSDYFISYYESSFLAERMSRDIEDDSRVKLMNLAFQIGNKNFLTGVGLANFRSYSGGMISHCSYAEAYAEGGIIQLVLFVMVLFGYCKNQIKRYRITKDGRFITFFITGILYVVFNVFYVFPSFALIMSFIFIIESESKQRLSELNS